MIESKKEKKKKYTYSTVVDIYVIRNVARIVAARDTDASQVGGARVAQDTHCHLYRLGKLTFTIL